MLKKKTEKSANLNMQCFIKTMRIFLEKSALVTVAMIDLLFNLMCLSLKAWENI